MVTPSFEDHFSISSGDYATYRPTYPHALFEYLAQIAPRRRLAWDCATGNGQAALALAPFFDQVIASDASREQIAAALKAPSNVRYRVWRAEDPALADGSVDLVTVAQAIHWLDHDAFNRQVQRVLVPGGVIAAWTYRLFRIDDGVDDIVERWYYGPLDSYWPAGRDHVEAAYRDIPFPFDPLPQPPLVMDALWDLDLLIGYLSTWSAVKRYEAERGTSPLDLIHRALSDAWGDPCTPRRVTWPLTFLLGRTAK